MNEESERWRADRSRDYLEHVRGLSRSLSSMQMEIEELRSKALPQGIVYSGMPGNPNSYGDAIPDAVIKLDDLVRRYCAEIADYVAEIEKAHDAIKGMGNAYEAEALRRHYLSNQSWELVCVEMGYTWNGMMTLRRRALANVYEFIPPQWRLKIPEAIE